jgi:outer membrane receptor protein involved in Fe transport
VFVADTLISYEAGIRTQTADRVFAIDASAYYLDWDNILIFASFPTAVGDVGANDNGQQARSFGFEATASIRPTRGLSFMINAAANHSELVGDTPPVTAGLDGDRLPFSPKFSGNISADYEWGLGGETTAFVGGNLRMVSQQAAGFDGTFRATFGRQPQIPGYEAIDLRAGVELERFTITAFVRNLTDSGGLTSLGAFTPGLAISAAAIRPRTFGVTLGANF